MLSAVTGLGKKGRSAAKVKKANTGKKGFFTKVKNAKQAVKKVVKSDKFKGKIKAAVKKVGRIIKKTNPVLIAARGGFIAAMRTNFAKIAEKAYWGFQTREFAKSKGISDAYYDACVKLKQKLVEIFVKKLGGDEGTIRKPIFNGRAAKKIAKTLKSKGMSGSTSELFGLGSDVSGLGVVAETSIVAAMAFLTPLIKLVSDMKKNKQGFDKDENGNAAEEPTTDAETEMNTTQNEASNPATGRQSSTVDNDGSIEQADAVNDENPEDFEKKKTNNTRLAKAPTNSTNNGSQNTEVQQDETSVATDETPKKSNIGLIAIVGAGLTLAAVVALKSKSKPQLNGLGNFSAKRETKNLKAKIAKAGLKMPHGYLVQKRSNVKAKSIKTIKI
jgi:hypothetical protein